MRVSEKGTKQYFPRQASADGSKFQATKPCNGERERAKESKSQRERAEKTKRKEGEMHSEAALGLVPF
jgi:hypothetical protein